MKNCFHCGKPHSGTRTICDLCWDALSKGDFSRGPQPSKLTAEANPQMDGGFYVGQLSGPQPPKPKSGFFDRGVAMKNVIMERINGTREVK